eukprot:GHVU01017420.1.p2 GENE.GHVU01017420.1~~GHVU01017420.1.p2  ORF type:complete len:161 (-),score=4.88 GHVU01017420.1:566-1048(-)
MHTRARTDTYTHAGTHTHAHTRARIHTHTPLCILTRVSNQPRTTVARAECVGAQVGAMTSTVANIGLQQGVDRESADAAMQHPTLELYICQPSTRSPSLPPPASQLHTTANPGVRVRRRQHSRCQAASKRRMRDNDSMPVGLCASVSEGELPGDATCVSC